VEESVTELRNSDLTLRVTFFLYSFNGIIIYFSNVFYAATIFIRNLKDEHVKFY
jgi:hypothetical protein